MLKEITNNRGHNEKDTRGVNNVYSRTMKLEYTFLVLILYEFLYL